MKDPVVKMLEDVGAVITDDHFVYTSGKHGSVYIRKDVLFPHTQLTSKACKLMAEKVKELGIEVVVGPSLAGIVMSQWVAYHLSEITGSEVLSVFTEKVYDDKQIYDRPQMFKRGYDRLVKGKKVLVVEDLTTTGGSVLKVVDRAREAGGEVVGVFVLVNRDPAEVNEGMMKAPFYSLAVFKAEAWEAKDCKLCKKNVPVNTEVAHGKEFLDKRGHGEV